MTVYREFFSQYPDPCLITDCEGRVLDLNAAMATLAGDTERKSIGKPVIDFLGADYSKPTCKSAGERPNPTRSGGRVVVLRLADGIALECSERIVTLKDPQGEISGLLHIFQPRGQVGDFTDGPFQVGTTSAALSVFDGITPPPLAKFAPIFDLAGVDFSEILVYDRERDEFSPASIWTPMEKAETRRPDLAVVAKRVLDTQIPAHPDLHEISQVESPTVDDIPEGLACYPIELVGQKYGVAWFVGVRRFGKQDRAVLSALVGIITAHLEQEYAERLAGERAARLEASRRIEIAIKESYDLKVALGVLLDQLIQHLFIHAGSVKRLKAGVLELETIAQRGFRTSLSTRINFRLGQHPPGKVAMDRLQLHLPVVREASTPTEWESMMAAEGFVGYFGIPLVARGSIKGVLEVFSSQPLYPDEDWESFFEMVADQAAIAIDKAELFENWQRSVASLDLSYDSTLQGWLRALQLRDKYTSVPDQKTIDKTLQLAMVFGVSDHALVHLRRGVILHDVGKIGVPDHILFKPGPLDETEWGIMQRHPVFAYEMLSPIPYLKDALDVPYCHHERWDGQGYPRGLKGIEIPLGARIFAIVDVWAAMTSPRPYRPAKSNREVRKYIEDNAGLHFDPQIVEVFLGLI